MQLLKLSRLAPDLDITDCQPFVFAPTPGPQTKVPRSGTTVLASPFPLFSIEVDGRDLTGCGEGIAIACVLCQELEPDDYLINILVSSPSGKWQTVPVTRVDGAYAELLDLIHVYIERLYADKQFTTRYGGKARYRNSEGRKKVFKPSNVIYLQGKDYHGVSKNHPNGQGLTPRSAWDVRAHWRKINPETLGLDRWGERTIYGATWIGCHSKGEGKLTTKVRKVMC